MDLKNIVVRNVTTEVPEGKNPMGRGPDEVTRFLVRETMNLRKGEYLPVECATPKDSAQMAQRARQSVLKRLGIGAKQRGNTVYFYRNGTH